MRDILAFRGVSICHSKILFRKQFLCCHAVKNVPFACMNPVIMKLSTRVVNWHSNIWANLSFHSIYCVKNLG